MITHLKTHNDDRDIKTAFVLCSTFTPNTAFPMMCQALFLLGDGTKNLDGTGGTFKIKVKIDSQESHELSFTVTAGDVRVALWTPQFPVPDNAIVTMFLLSPNAADDDVDVTVHLYDCSPVSYVPAESTGVETTLEGMIKQLWRRLFKKSTLTATQLKTYEDDGTTVATTQTVSDDQTTETQGAAT